jgi:hypothetical protein
MSNYVLPKYGSTKKRFALKLRSTKFHSTKKSSYAKIRFSKIKNQPNSVLPNSVLLKSVSPSAAVFLSLFLPLLPLPPLHSLYAAPHGSGCQVACRLSARAMDDSRRVDVTPPVTKQRTRQQPAASS